MFNVHVDRKDKETTEYIFIITYEIYKSITNTNLDCFFNVKKHAVCLTGEANLRVKGEFSLAT